MPNTKSNLEGIGQSDFQLVDYPLNPDVDMLIQQAIAYLSGYNSATNRFKALQTDNNGRLLVSLSNVSISTVNQSQINIPAVDTLVLAVNANRTNFFLQNIGSIQLLIGFAQGLSLTVPIYFNPGMTLTWDGYTGPIYAFGGVGGQIAFVEY